MNENGDEDFETTSGVSSCCLPQQNLLPGDGKSLQFDGHGGRTGNGTVGWSGSTCWTAF